MRFANIAKNPLLWEHPEELGTIIDLGELAIRTSRLFRNIAISQYWFFIYKIKWSRDTLYYFRKNNLIMKQVFTILLCLLTNGLNAQAPNIVYSEPFDEPEDLATKIVLCNNGNTLLFHFMHKEGVMVDVYDALHNPIAHTPNNSEVLNTKNYYSSQLRGIYNMGDQVVAFMQVNAKKEYPKLYRIAFSSVSGKMLSEDETAIVPEKFRSRDRAGKYVDVGQFYLVKKDPVSDAYAIVTYFGQDLDGAAKPFVFHYNGKHEEIGSGVINGPNNQFAFSYYADMVVRGVEEVWIATRPFNTGKGGTREASAILLTRLKGKDTSSAIVNSWNTRRECNVALGYDDREHVIRLLTLVLVSSKTTQNVAGVARVVNTYAANLIALDVKNLSLKHNKNLDYSSATNFRNKHYQVGIPYTGLPMDMLINADGTTTILSEEDGKLPSHDVAVVDYDAQGQAIDGLCIRRGTSSSNWFNALNNGRNGGQPLAHAAAGWADPGYFAYDYVQTPKGRFVFFNDHPANFERDAEKTPKFLTGVSDANTICYRVVGDEVSKFYLFGQPDKSFDNRFANFMSASYDQNRHLYAVMVVEKNGRKKQSRLAWVGF